MNLGNNIKITNEDNMELMSRYPDNYFELAIVDVPYGIKQGGDKNHTRGGLATAINYKPFNDNQSPELSYFSELLRVSKNQIIWGANHFISKIPFDSSCWVVWDKMNGSSDFADCELACTSFRTAVRLFRFRWSGMLQGNMKNKERRIHPTQKPVQLYKWLLSYYAKPNDKILDTNLGSGSLAIACHDMGFSLTACELYKDYFDGAIKRIKQHQDQQNLFPA